MTKRKETIPPKALQTVEARPGETIPQASHEELKKLAESSDPIDATARVDQLRRAERKEIYFHEKTELKGAQEREQSASYSVSLLQAYVVRDVQAGARVRSGGLKGARIAHGEPQNRQNKYARMQSAIDAAAREYPNENFRQLAARVAHDLNCHERTIRKHTRNPRPRGE